MKKMQIMIVEDENIVAMDIERSLKRLGYGVPAMVAMGESAIVEAERILPDLILMDIQLKGKMSGIEAAKEIQKRLNIPVIFLTAYADEHTLEKAKEAEAYGYILKPFEEVELRTTIEVVLKKHSSVALKQQTVAEKSALAEEMFSLFIDSVKDYAIYMLNTNGEIVSWNEGAARIHGFSAEDVLTKSFDVLFYDHEKEEKISRALIKKALSFGRYTEERWMNRKDHLEFWGGITITVIYGKKEEHIGFGVVVQDLTKKKKEEVFLQKSIVERDEFLAQASHELRTPLTILKLHADLFTDDMKKDEVHLDKVKVEKLLTTTMNQIQRLTYLVEDMLDLSRISVGKLVVHREKVNFYNILQEMINRHAAGFEKVGCGDPEFITNSKEVYGILDKARIEQVISKLFNNVMVFAYGKPVRITLKKEINNLLLQVEDHGPGIAKKDMKKIFHRFERIDESNDRGGLGLGLYISNSIIESHGGSMWVESEEGHGASFFIELPIINS